MIRLASPADAPQLFKLNEQFNGLSDTTIEAMAAALEGNPQEIVAVADEEGVLCGFVCAQVKRSFCYALPCAEITEVYVAEPYRRRGLAGAMLSFVEGVCAEKFHVRDLSVLTGQDNDSAQALYQKHSYEREDEVLLVKRIPE